jgi:hypothetical protein
MYKSLGWALKKQQNFGVRIRQQIYRRKTNYPFLSGDSFAIACDVSVDPNFKNSKTKLSDANSIFCPSEKIEEFLAECGDLISAKVLVLGNTDRDFYEIPCEFPSSIKRVYMQNSHISDELFRTLPIGIENLRYGQNGLLSLFDRNQFPTEKKEILLVGPFSLTHPERLELADWTKIRDPRLRTISERMSPRNLASLARDFKFVACPRGNGTDTHRFWETLYRGSIPVVKRSRWSDSISELGIPIVQLENWNFEEFLETTTNGIWSLFNPEEIPALWMDHWSLTFKSKIE